MRCSKHGWRNRQAADRHTAFTPQNSLPFFGRTGSFLFPAQPRDRGGADQPGNRTGGKDGISGFVSANNTRLHPVNAAYPGGNPRIGNTSTGAVHPGYSPGAQRPGIPAVATHCHPRWGRKAEHPHAVVFPFHHVLSHSLASCVGMGGFSGLFLSGRLRVRD